VASSGNLPLGGGSGASINIEGRIVEGVRPPESRYASVSDDYFETLGIPLVRGRTFTPADHDDAPDVVIISNSLARRFWPGGDPIGVRVKIGPDPAVPWSTIVGVVGDVRFGPAGEYMPTVYASSRQDHWGGGAVLVRSSGDPAALSAGVREAVKRVDPILPITDLQTLEEYRGSTQAVADRRLQLQLMLVFALAALLLSAIGVYGASAYSVEARRREFGIRMALGAPRTRVLMLALGDGARAASVGMLVGVPLSLLLASRLRELLFQVRPFDPATVAVVLGVLGLVVLAASIGPARRATRVDPVRAMRAE
jgi:predicted permease